MCGPEVNQSDTYRFTSGILLVHFVSPCAWGGAHVIGTVAPGTPLPWGLTGASRFLGPPPPGASRPHPEAPLAGPSDLHSAFTCITYQHAQPEGAQADRRTRADRRHVRCSLARRVLVYDPKGSDGGGSLIPPAPTSVSGDLAAKEADFATTKLQLTSAGKAGSHAGVACLAPAGEGSRCHAVAPEKAKG